MAHLVYIAFGTDCTRPNCSAIGRLDSVFQCHSQWDDKMSINFGAEYSNKQPDGGLQ